MRDGLVGEREEKGCKDEHDGHRGDCDIAKHVGDKLVGGSGLDARMRWRLSAFDPEVRQKAPRRKIQRRPHACAKDAGHVGWGWNDPLSSPIELSIEQVFPSPL